MSAHLEEAERAAEDGGPRVRQAAKVQDASHSLYDADPNCRHEIVALWSGVKCKHCTGWFCW